VLPFILVVQKKLQLPVTHSGTINSINSITASSMAINLICIIYFSAVQIF
tara:strand:+ start:3074 stop:3223 length:150 start_codon:yes stop_codon:yes gene_type:complete